MKKIILSSLLAISVLSFSACQSQAAYVERPMPTEKLVNNQLPDIPADLLKPIPISNMQSPTGKEDFTKFFKLLNESNLEFMPNFDEQLLLSSQNFDGNLENFEKDVKKRIENHIKNVWNQSEKEIKKLEELKAKIQDKEVKAIIQYMINVFKFSMDSWAKMTNTYIKKEKPTVHDYSLFNEANRKFELKSEPVKEIFRDAMSKFMKKYEEK